MQIQQQEIEVDNMFLEVNSLYNWYIPTGLKKFDELLKGGFLRGAVSQIYGEAGTAKSQLAMQFIIGASLHNNNTFVISTNKMFHTQRFEQLKHHYQSTHKVTIEKKWEIQQCSAILKFDDIFDILQQSRGIDLLIIDNIYRVITDKMSQQQLHGKSDVYHKARIQRIFANTLRQLAKKRKMAVVLINNAAASISENRYNNKTQLKAALSTSWDNQMDENIVVTKQDHTRRMKILFSVKAPSKEVTFTIENNKGFVV